MEGITTLRTMEEKNAMKRRVYRIGFVVGVIALPLFIAAMVWVFAFPAPPLGPDSVAIIEGVAESSIMPDPANGLREYRLAVAGEPVIMQMISMYQTPGALAKAALIVPGTTRVQVGVPAEEMAKPSRNRSMGYDFRLICSLTIDGESAYTLDDYNTAVRKNENIGKAILPALAAVAALLTAYTALKLFRKKPA